MSTLDQYKAYVTTCAAGGVLPCSYQAFAADQARTCPTAEALNPASIATGALAQAPGHLMHLVAMIVDRDTPPDLDGDHVVDWDITGKPITRRMVSDWAKAGREGGHLMQAQSAGTRMGTGSAPGLAAGAKSNDCRRRARIEAKWRLRAWQREYGAYQLFHTLHDIGMAAWLFGKLHAEAATLSAQETAAMRAQLLRKLALAELVIAQGARELADILNTTLWLYRRLPQAYGNPPFVDQAILKMAERLGMDDVPAAIKERATLAANSSTREDQ